MWGCNEIHNRCWARRSRLFSPAASGGYTCLLAPATQEGGNDHAVVSPIGASLCCAARPVDAKRVRGRSPPAEQRSVHQQHQSASDRGRARYVRIRYDDRLRFPGGPFLQRRRLGHRLCHFERWWQNVHQWLPAGHDLPLNAGQPYVRARERSFCRLRRQSQRLDDLLPRDSGCSGSG